MPENATPAVVVGQKYVVGENPTDSFGMGLEGLRYLATDRTVNVEDIDDLGRGACCYDDDSGHFVGYVDPRHLTPAPEPMSVCRKPSDTAEPTAAPAMDDDLLRDIHRAAGVGSAWSNKPEQFAARLLASEPMQRLRADWTAEATARLLLERDRARDELADARDRHREVTVELTAERNQAVRERDDARATKDLHKERQQELETALNTAERERDEARTERDEAVRLALEAQELCRNAQDRAEEAMSEVERLSAAQQLPDVQPVERSVIGIREALRCDVTVPDDPGMTGFAWPVTLVPYAAAAANKMLAFLDAEAADTSSDDEVDELARVLHAADGPHRTWEQSGSRDAYRRLARAAIAHRARGSKDQS